jgi:hypothetical protein
MLGFLIVNPTYDDGRSRCERFIFMGVDDDPVILLLLELPASLPGLNPVLQPLLVPEQ